MALIDKASLLMVPSTYEAGKLYNVLPSGNRAPDSTDQNSGYDQTRADFDFDRGSNASATRIGSDGLIKKYRENLLLQSNQFDTTWLNQLGGTITGGQSGYDGSNDAWLISKSASNFKSVRQVISYSGVTTFSVYAKAGTLTKAALRMDTSAGAVQIIYDLSLGVVSSSGGVFISRGIENVGNGWYRIFVSVNVSSGTNVHIYADRDGTTAGSIYIQNSQLEKSLVASSYLDSTSVTGKAGVLVDLPRINYDANGENGALLLEPLRSNIVASSEYLSHSSWQNVSCTITTNNTISPEGVGNATLLSATGSTSNRVQDYFGPLSGVHTYSIYIKSTGTATRLNLQTNDSGGLTLDVPASGTPTIQAQGSSNISGSVFIDAVGTNGWYRVGFSYTPTGGAVNNYFQIYPDSQNGTGSIYLWGIQNESGSYVSSYIPTMGTSETRAADSCSVTGVSDVIGQTEGTLFLEFDHRYMSSYPNEYIIDIEGGTNKIWIRKESAGSTLTSRLIVGGTNIWTIAISATDGAAKIALAYKSGDNAVYYNGSQVGTSSATYTGNSFSDIYFNLVGSSNPELKAKNLTLFNERLSNAELATLTTL